MTIALASAWHPRGELARFQKLLPQLNQVYASIAISLPPETEREYVQTLERENIKVAITRDWSHGRHAALTKALDSGQGVQPSPLAPTHIHYCDFDRLLHWVETRPDELGDIITKSQTTDCLIVGRAERAYETHPRALVQTEAISNAVVSQFLGRPMDISAGSKSFSRKAAEYLLQHSPPGRALGMDSEWILLLHYAGFRVDYVEADGLDWESADRYAEVAADRDAQKRAADEYDADPKHWARRVEIAMEIVECALSATHRKSEGSMQKEFIEAIKKGDTEKINTLLTQDRALVNSKSETGESAILVAIYYGRRGIANVLWDFGAEMNVWEASAVGATERVKEWIEREPSLIRAHSHDGFTPLQLAAFFGNADTVEMLATRGADVNAISHNQTFARGVPILQSAVASGNVLAVKILLEHGANVNVLNEQEGTPLYLAAFEGNSAMVKLLLANGANPNLKTKDGMTPLDLAKKEGYQEIVGLLESKT